MSTTYTATALQGVADDTTVASTPPDAVRAPTRSPVAANDDAATFTPVGGRPTGVRVANDNRVSTLALGRALAVAANDDAAGDPESPLPGSYAAVPPAAWPSDHPHVVRLLAETMAVVADPASGPNERRVALALVGVATDGGGRLPAYAGRPAILAFRRRHGLPSGSMIAGRASRAVFDRLAPRFLLEEVDSTFETRSGSFFRAARDNVVSRMRGYVDRCVEGGVAVPSNGRGGFSVEGVAAALGEKPSRLRWNVPARGILREAIASGSVRLGNRYEPDPGMSDVERRARIADLKAFWSGFDVPGGKVPESPLRRGYVDWKLGSQLSGETDPSVLDDRSVRAHVFDIARRRGVMLPGLMDRIDNLGALRAWGLEQIAREAVGKPSAAAIVSNHKAAFDRIVREAGLTLEDGAEALFGAEAFDAALDRSLSGFANPRSAANVRRAGARWKELHAARVGAAGLPDALPDAVDALLGSRGVTQAALSERLGVKPSAVRDLILGSCSLSHRGWRMVTEMERVFELAPGTLTSKAGRTPPRPTIATATPDYRALPLRMRPLLPPMATTWSGERLAAAVAQVAPLLAGATSYGRMLQAGNARGERMPAFAPTDRLARDLEAYRRYKEAPISSPFARAPGARWKSPLSAEMGMKDLGMTYRFATAPVDGGTAAGLGIDPGLQTLAWLAHAPFAAGLFAQRSMRNADLPDGKGGMRGRAYTVAERHLAAQLLSMTNPVTGYLTQRPGLAGELVALDARLAPGHDDLLRHFGQGDGTLVLSDEDVALARRDWPAFVARSHAAYGQIVEHLDDVLEVSRNPFEGIRGIVEDAEPQARLLGAIFGAEDSWADERTSPLLHRLDVRNSVMLRLAAITAFRPANLVGLTFRADGEGKLRKVDGRWEIAVPRREFKNFRNSRLFGTATSPLDYHMVLRDEAGLYPLMDRFFFELLPQLRTGLGGDAAFVGRLGAPITAKGWYEVVRWFGRLHVARNPVLGIGIAGVTSLNPYSFRHVRASDVLRNGTSANRVEEAAMALQTSEGMIRRHYGFLLPDAASASGSDTFGRAARLAWGK